MRLGWERCDGSTVPPDKRRAHLVSAWPSKRFQAYTEATSKLYIQGNQKANIYGLQLIPYPASSVALKGIEGRSFFFFFCTQLNCQDNVFKKITIDFFLPRTVYACITCEVLFTHDKVGKDLGGY